MRSNDVVWQAWDIEASVSVGRVETRDGLQENELGHWVVVRTKSSDKVIK